MTRRLAATSPRCGSCARPSVCAASLRKRGCAYFGASPLLRKPTQPTQRAPLRDAALRRFSLRSKVPFETASECRSCFFGAFPHRPRRERKCSPVVGVWTLGRRDGFEGHPNGGVRVVITSASRCAIDFPDTTTRSRESSNIASSISIPELLFPLLTHKAELSRRRAGTRRV